MSPLLSAASSAAAGPMPSAPELLREGGALTHLHQSNFLGLSTFLGGGVHWTTAAAAPGRRRVFVGAPPSCARGRLRLPHPQPGDARHSRKPPTLQFPDQEQSRIHLGERAKSGLNAELMEVEQKRN